jgi:type I restriction enzyme, S subunit
MEFQQYPSYKKFNDGVLNSLPQSWNNKPFWAVFKKSEITNKVNEQLLSVYLDRGVILYSDGGGLVHKPAESLEKYQLVHVDDFVMNNQQAWRGAEIKLFKDHTHIFRKISNVIFKIGFSFRTA